mmetsp:Transcript_11654/g.31275  ORF Transcript_11654/g.31275 Transcript_11654/m.31275 type:complete len:224 (+) Transcript_11654:619-1290(+)
MCNTVAPVFPHLAVLAVVLRMLCAAGVTMVTTGVTAQRNLARHVISQLAIVAASWPMLSDANATSVTARKASNATTRVLPQRSQGTAGEVHWGDRRASRHCTGIAAIFVVGVAAETLPNLVRQHLPLRLVGESAAASTEGAHDAGHERNNRPGHRFAAHHLPRHQKRVAQKFWQRRSISRVALEASSEDVHDLRLGLFTVLGEAVVVRKCKNMAWVPQRHVLA